MCVCVCERERERERVCVCVRERESMYARIYACMYVCVQAGGLPDVHLRVGEWEEGRH